MNDSSNYHDECRNDDVRLRDQLAMAALTGIADAMLEARAERERCAKLVETLPFVYIAVPGVGAYVDEAATRASMVRAIMDKS